MDDINGIRLKDLYSIVPKRLAQVLEEEGIHTVGELDSLNMEEFNKHMEADATLESYLNQLRHKIATRPVEIWAAAGAEQIVLHDDEEEDLRFMESFTRVLNEYHNFQAMGKPSESTILDWKAIKEKEEDVNIEFKSSLRWDLEKRKIEKDLEEACAKTIASFLNRNGGRLIIGMEDDGQVLGLEKDFETFSKKRGDKADWFKRQISTVIEKYLGGWVLGLVRIKLVSIDNNQLCIVRVQPSPEPCYMKMLNGKEQFYIRSSASSKPLLNPSDINKYIVQRWK
jgi:hypothetical protein